MAEMVVEASMALALGAKLCRPKVVSMYPITPQTHIVERLADFISNGELDAEMIHAESEHSAMAAMIGAAATGVRTYTATCSQGFALMFELLPIMAGNRLPGVMSVANRALSAPINIWNDHSDAVSGRDQGWMQIYCESTQEAIDTTIQLYKVSEDHKVLLPGMVCIDGFTLSHVCERAIVPEQEEVDKFLPAFKPFVTLDPDKPVSIGPISFPNTYMEFKKQQQEAIIGALPVIQKVHDEYAKKFGRAYGNGLIEEYRMKDAERAIIGMGTLCGTGRIAVDELRAKGEKVGMIKLRSLRPFPVKELQKSAKNLKGLSVIDRHVSMGFEGPLCTDVRSALYGSGIEVNGFIAGLGGRDITVDRLQKALLSTKTHKQGEWLL
ncbi:MAG: pyruvate ferredoxin oxidoreductase [Candidatus Diapherotrites archaeon]